jgi:hydroxymethylpyrimidine pyrophosphatase-like HAD family hydrolase
MPKLMYNEKELQLIAETLYDIDFGKAPKMRMTMMGANGMQLNNGKKWKLKPVSIQQMDAVIKKVNDFKSDNIVEYNQLGKAIFNDAKKIMLDDSYTGEKFDQIHLFFYGIEGNMHTLMVIKSTDEAKNQLAELKNKLNEFNTYFE